MEKEQNQDSISSNPEDKEKEEITPQTTDDKIKNESEED